MKLLYCPVGAEMAGKQERVEWRVWQLEFVDVCFSARVFAILSGGFGTRPGKNKTINQLTNWQFMLSA